MSTLVPQPLDTGRIRTGYRHHGDDDGLPILFLHGSYATSRWWEPFFDILPPAIYAVAPDMRGCGASERPDRDYTIEAMAADIAAFVDALGWDEFDLVGHSSGGAVAIELALAHSAEIRTLTLVDSAPIEGVFTPLEAFTLLDRMRTEPNLLEQALASLMPTIDRENDAAMAAFFDTLVKDAQAMAHPVFTEIAAALSNWNRFADAHRLTLPTLLVWGDQDIVVDRDATTRSLIAIPGAGNLEVLRGVGHSPMIEAPVILAERMIEFITEDLEEYADARQIAEEFAEGSSPELPTGNDPAGEPGDAPGTADSGA